MNLRQSRAHGWPLTERRPPRLWPRTRRINRHIAERSLRIAAFGPHTCRPFPVRITTGSREVTPTGH